MQVEHSSVMLDRCITLLTPSIEKTSSPVVVDATLGLGGHSFALLKKFPQLKIVGLDRDLKAIKKATARLHEFSDDDLKRCTESKCCICGSEFKNATYSAIHIALHHNSLLNHT